MIDPMLEIEMDNISKSMKDICEVVIANTKFIQAQHDIIKEMLSILRELNDRGLK